MRVLVVGAGGVGSAIVSAVSEGDVISHLVVADVDGRRAARAVAGLDGGRFTALTADASDQSGLEELARAHRVDLILNACDPRFNPPIFGAAFASGCNYLDMAMNLSEPHPERPFEQPGKLLGADQLAASADWEARGLLALVGMGVEPGLADVFARYAADHLFSAIDEVGVRDGGDLQIDGYAFAPTFSVWTTIEECLNPPIVWERDRGWFTIAPLSAPELFTFPDGIGTVACFDVEHEEVVLVPRWVDCRRVTFKYGLDDEFIEMLRMFDKTGLASTAPVRVRGVEVSPRDVVAAVLPDPATLGDRMHGRTCAGTWISGTGVDGAPRESYLYHLADNQETMARHHSQAVVWQTAVCAVVGLEMIATNNWQGAGVLGPEAFDAVPFLDRLRARGEEWVVQERAASTSTR